MTLAPDPSVPAGRRPATGRGAVTAATPGGGRESAAALKAAKPETMSWQARLLHAVNRVYVHGYHRLDVQTPPTLPARGPAILVCNHISGLDPLLLQAALRRRVVWMMAAEYYDLPVLSWVFRAVGTIPVDRGGRDTTATRAALRALAAGQVLGIFPEGKLATTRHLLPFQSGVAMMAARAGVPVFPAYLDGTNRGLGMLPAFLKPNETRVRFGPSIRLHTQRGVKPNLNIFTEHIFESVAKLQQEAGYK